MPQDIPGLYGSGLDLAADPKQRVEALQGKVIVECSEMVGAGRADIAKLKDFISRTDDGSIRLTWRRDPEPMPRRCVMVGTADRRHFLSRDDNLRRFVPIQLTGGIPVRVAKYMNDNRDRLWREAVDLFHQNIPPQLPDKLVEIGTVKGQRCPTLGTGGQRVTQLIWRLCRVCTPFCVKVLGCSSFDLIDLSVLTQVTQE